MKLSKALNEHFSCDKKSKIVQYFGHSIVVPKNTIAIATDKNGFLNFYQNSIPETDQEFWFSETEQEPQGILLKNKNTTIEDWKDSLLIL